MPIPEWQEQLIHAAAKWPRGSAPASVMEPGKAPESVQTEFFAWAERIAQKLDFLRSGIDPAGALLYRLKAAGHYVRSKTVFRKHPKAASAAEHAPIYPLRSALIRYITSGYNLAPSIRAALDDTGQAAASNN